MMDKKKGGLGRGLSALLDEIKLTPDSASAETTATSAGVAVQTLPIASIRPNPRQPRRRFDETALAELTASVRERGLIQPILVRPKGDAYEIVAGERRWRAAQAAQLHEVPVVVRALDDSATFEIALVENIQRADLNPIEEAEGYRRLIDEYGHTQEELGRLTAKSRSHIANLLRLLDLPEAVRSHVVEGRMTMGHARALVSAPDAAALAIQVIERGLSVRQTEALAADTRAAPPRTRNRSGTPAPDPKDSDTLALERSLSETLGLPITIDADGIRGRVQIAYTDLDQLDMLCQRLMGERF
jgi:ParB family chromosome partitioning protein